MAFGPIFAPFPIVIPDPIVATPCPSSLRHGTDDRILTDHNVLGNDAVFHNGTGLD